MAYKLLKDGETVSTSENKITRDGVSTVMRRATIGRSGDTFTWLPDDLKQRIEAGELEDTWEVIPDEDVNAVDDVIPNESDAVGPAAYPAVTGEDKMKIVATEAEAEGAIVEPTDDLEGKTDEELTALAQERGIEITGTGTRGRVTHADLLKALTPEAKGA